MNLTLTIALALLTPIAAPEKPSAEYQQCVRSGLKWLAAQQKADGSWISSNDFAPTTSTAYAGLAFLMEGSTPKTGEYSKQLQKAIEWFEKNAADNGKLASNGTNELFQATASHSHALLFLACAYDVDDDETRRTRLRKIIEKAVVLLGENQTKLGGWGYELPRMANEYDDTNLTAIVLQSLLATRRSGIEVPKKITDRAIDYLVRATNPEGGIIFTLSGGARPMGRDGNAQATASAAASLMLHDGTRPTHYPKWVRYSDQYNIGFVRQLRMPGGIFALPQLLPLTQTAYALGENGHRRLDPTLKEIDLLKWSNTKANLYKSIKDLQTKDGNWPDPGFGTAYSTGIALFILQLENGYVPAFSR